MRVHAAGFSLVACVAALMLAPQPSYAQTAHADESSPRWTPPLTPWGAPDLQGIWDYKTATPLERPPEFEGREFLTDEEVAVYERRAVTRSDGRPPDDPRSAPSVHAPEWLDYGKSVVGTKRTSLIVDPPDGRMPALSPEGERRDAARRRARQGRGTADSYGDRGLWERCITRGLPTGMMPAGYNNHVQLLQTPDAVVIFSEMIHDARIVPLGDRPHLGDDIRQWLGDPRAWWDGDTLVVETTNFSEKSHFRGAGADLRLVERFTRVDPETVTYEFTVADPTTWTTAWTVTFPLTKSVGPLFEYACHEGNHGLLNILTVARSTPAQP